MNLCGVSQMLGCVAATAIVLNASHAVADESLARQLVESAEEAEQEGSLERAEALLRQSLDEWPWSYAAFNLARLLAATEREVEALQILERIERGELGDVTGPALEQTRAEAERLSARVATLRLGWREERDVSIHLDEELVLVVEASRSALVRAAAGAHQLTLQSPNAREIRLELLLREGESQDHTLRFDPVPEGAIQPVAVDEPPKRFRWIWGLAAGLLAVGVAVGLAVVFSSGDDHADAVDVPI